MNPLVSVIIPCYNCDRWIGEGINSVLAQTYPNIEIIVVDDGSTDSSLEIIKSYSDQVKWLTGKNQGGNVARNRGFQLSQGKYIQWLDADDYLLPQKIEQQVKFLEQNNCDVVYGDWRHQHHQADGNYFLEDIKFSGKQTDVLESLLSGWWAAPLAYLIRREKVAEINGWDENLKVGQDRDFWIRVAIAQAKFAYQPGCYSIYRRYGDVTVSTNNYRRWCDSHGEILQKSWQLLNANNNLRRNYQKALAKSHFELARRYFDLNPNLYQYHLQKVRELDRTFQPHENFFYNLLAKYFGFTVADRCASFKRKYWQPS
ncbi:MAG: hypothetical protein Tsb0014_20230 [Pleurocapsa sp.]